MKFFSTIPLAMALVSMLLASCMDNSRGTQQVTGSFTPISDEPQSTRDMTFTIEGHLDADAPDAATQYEKVIWTHFPSDVDELRQAQQQLGHSLGGAVALQLMAFEIYRHDRTAGEEAVRLVNHRNNHSSVLRQLSQHFSETTNPDDLYIQPYLVACNLEGATTDNHYSPTHPYSITVYWDKARQVEQASVYMGGGQLFYVHLLNPNYSTPERRVQVILNEGAQYLLIHNSPSLYTQCPPILGEWTYEMR